MELVTKYLEFIQERKDEYYAYPIDKALKFFSELNRMYRWFEISQFSNEKPLTWDDLTVKGKIKVLEYNYEEETDE